MATNPPSQGIFQRLRTLVAGPVDIAWLAAFRFLFGLTMAAAMVRFTLKGWVRQLYVDPAFYFTYPGFEWIHPWPAPFMHVHFILLALLAIGVALGLFYRFCITLFFLGFTYIELLDQTAYLNHYYLISLLAGLMIFLPANRAWSIDARRKRSLRVDAVPGWTLGLLRFQIGIVYVFAGLAKLNPDWLLKAQPLRIWLAARADLPLIGPWLGNLGVAYAASWFGAFFDVFIVFFLLYRPTRRAAYAAVVIFHLATWVLFNIGMFPWIMIVAATVFFQADWPRRSLALLGGFVAKVFSIRLARRLGSAAAVEQPFRALPCWKPSFLFFPLGLYAALQLALPLRSYFTAEPSAWTCSGFNCAWRVMIAEKTGYVEFYAFDPATGGRWRLSAERYLTSRQQIMMAQDPGLIRSMARRLGADLKAQGHANAQIKADAFATLNGRPSQRLINPEVDLAGSPAPNWIVPLAE